MAFVCNSNPKMHTKLFISLNTCLISEGNQLSPSQVSILVGTYGYVQQIKHKAYYTHRPNSILGYTSFFLAKLVYSI